MPTLALPIAIAATAAASTATGIYGTRSANKTNKRAQQLQDEADRRAADLDAQRIATEKAQADATIKLNTDKLALDKQRWQDYLQANKPMWDAAGGTLRSIYGMMGLSGAPSSIGPGMDAPMPGTTSPPPSTVMPTRPIQSPTPRPAPAYGTMPVPQGNTGFSLDQIMALANSMPKPFGSTPVAGGT